MSQWLGGVAAGRPSTGGNGGTLVVCPNGHAQRVVFQDAAERLMFAGRILDNITNRSKSSAVTGTADDSERLTPSTYAAPFAHRLGRGLCYRISAATPF